MKILGLIPARGGSKGILHKNKKLLGNKPLLQYTVEAAQKARLISDVVFTSEDATLIEIASSLGVACPFTRPAALATDQAGSLEVVQHALETLTQQYDAVCLLQVTTPFREEGFIDAAIQKFIDGNTDSLISVQEVPHQYNPHWVFEPNGPVLNISTGEKQIIKRRQELPKTYIRDGAIYLTKTDVIVTQHSFFGESIGFLESNPKTFVNIDTIDDWKEAERILNSGLI